jgi:ribonuclease BN (tRNA processing enzyme)
MGAKLIFLGTAGDSTTMGKQILASGGILLQDNETQIHIDPGPGSLVKAKEYGANIRNNDIILVSKNSTLHGGDLNAVIDAMTLGGMDRKGVLLCCHSVVSESETFTPLISKTQKNNVERVIALRIGDKVGIANISISPTKTSFPEEDAVGFKIIAPKYCIGYTSNTSYAKSIAEQYKGCDILVVNMNTSNNSEKDVESAISLVKDAKPRLVVLTHFSVKMLKEDVLSLVRKIHKATNVQAILAKDGLNVNVDSYAAKTRQKSLDPF